PQLFYGRVGGLWLCLAYSSRTKSIVWSQFSQRLHTEFGESMNQICQTPRPVQELATSGNLRSVEDRKLYRSGQLNGPALRDMLTRHGIRTTINLRGVGRGQSWYDDELLASKALGVFHFDFGLSLRQEIDDETLRQLLRLLQKVP